MAVSSAEALLEPLREIDGFVLACLVNASTGTVLGSAQDEAGADVAVAVAGAADIAQTISLMVAQSPESGELEDVIVTLSRRYHLIRPIQALPGERLLLFVALDRLRANLAMARRELREFDAGLAR